MYVQTFAKLFVCLVCHKMVTGRCDKNNLKHYKITDYKIKKRNAVEINDKFDYAVTDLPYGLNSNVISEYHKENWKKGRINKKVQTKNFVRDLENFYLRFLKNRSEQELF